MNKDCPYERVTKREQKIARSRAVSILRNVQKELKDTYRMTFRIAGSGCWGTMIKSPNGTYDLDYQIILTSNSKMYKDHRKFLEKDTRKAFQEAFDKFKNNNESIDSSRSTAITLRNECTDQKGFSIDFVIMTEVNDCTEILRRTDKQCYSWNKLSTKFTDVYKKFKEMDVKDKNTIIDNVIKRKYEKKYNGKEKDKESCEILIEEINNYVKNM